MRAGEESEREGDSDLIITRAASGYSPTAPVRVMGVNGLAVSHGATCLASGSGPSENGLKR